MKKILFSILVLFGVVAGTNAEALHEASMNFDLDGVRPFLVKISGLVESGLEKPEIDKLFMFTKNVNVNEEKETTIKVVFKGKETILKYRVFMDDIDAPNLYFFTSKELSGAIEHEMIKYAKELGI